MQNEPTMKKQKIIFLDTNDEIGGVITVLLHILHRLDAGRFAITLACEKGGKPEAEFRKVSGLQVVRCRFGTKPVGISGAGLRSRLYDLTSFPRLVWTVLRLAIVVILTRIDVIYTSDKIRSVLVATLLSYLTGRRIVYHIHGMCVPSRLNRIALTRASAILANSAATKRDFVRLIGPEMERIEVVHNGINPAVEVEGADLRDGLGIPADAVTVGIFSRLAPNKGQEEFIEAAAHVAAAVPDTHFIVAGDESIFDGNAGFRRRLEDLAHRLEIHDRVHFLGFCTDMPCVYRTIDIAVDAAWEEAFGMVVIEPMAFSRPVVGTDAGGIPEIIEHGSNGLLVPPRNPVQLGRAILELVEDQEKRRTIGRAARLSVEKRFSIDAQVAKVSGILVESGS